MRTQLRALNFGIPPQNRLCCPRIEDGEFGEFPQPEVQQLLLPGLSRAGEGDQLSPGGCDTPLALPELCRFLCLAGNRIQRVQNLQGLSQLSVLDLSHNLIQVLHTGGSRNPSGAACIPVPSCLGFPGCGGAGGLWGSRNCGSQLSPPVLSLSPGRGAAPQPPDPRPGREPVHPAGGIQGLNPCSPPCGSDFLGGLQRELAGRARLRRAISREEHRARLEELRERRALLLGSGQHGTARPCPQLCPQREPGARLSPLPASSGSLGAPGAIQPPGEALEEETRAKGAGNGQLSQISCSSSQE
ncbi:uncharacterized protein LOC132339088 [Haemorhous mexicanus]|uniref:uncharacterized protein LOC132339088 n=1 Tax=Haemorhous mexicanus TaxID=30427 RepID=UPI0028BF4DC2|nr:uncharacterized protein LOC132339088 [Haemorhous mexicanus]